MYGLSQEGEKGQCILVCPYHLLTRSDKTNFHLKNRVSREHLLDLQSWVKQESCCAPAVGGKAGTSCPPSSPLPRQG